MNSKSPEKFPEAMTAVDDYCTKNDPVLKKRSVVKAVIL